MKLILPSDYSRMPWKNGGGVTEEIAREPVSGPYSYRLSRAYIAESGDFSSFPGYDRLLTVSQGNGIWLNDQKVPSFEVLRFRGEDPNHCRLVDGAVFDIGLIFDRQLLSAEMLIISNEGHQRRLPEGLHFFYAAEAMRAVNGVLVPQGATLKLEGGHVVDIALAPGRSILVSIQPSAAK